jgi:hypothetical protein
MSRGCTKTAAENTLKVQTMNPMFLNACYYVNYDYEYLPSANNRKYHYFHNAAVYSPELHMAVTVKRPYNNAINTMGSIRYI